MYNSLFNMTRGIQINIIQLVICRKSFVEKVREAFALQKLLTFFQQKILANLRY